MNFRIPPNSLYCEHQGRFPFDQNFPFAYPEISSGEWKSISHNLRKKGQPCAAYPAKFPKMSHREFLSHLILIPAFRSFRLNSSLFGNVTVLGRSGNFPRIFFYQLLPLRKRWHFWFNYMSPRFCKQACCSYFCYFIQSAKIDSEAIPAQRNAVFIRN